MLDIIRKKASSWVTRGIFALVVLVFIFFFGYNQIITPNQGPQAVLVRVNGHDIRQNEFSLAYKKTLEDYKQMLKGELPEGMEKMVSQATLQDLIVRRLMVNAASQMGLTVSNEELFKVIENNNKQFIHDGQFDRVAYRQELLNYERENGLNYEEMLRNDLLAKKLRDLIQSAAKVSPAEAKDAYWKQKAEKKETALDADWKKDEAQFTKDLLLQKQQRMIQEWTQSQVRKAEIEQLMTPNAG